MPLEVHEAPAAEKPKTKAVKAAAAATAPDYSYDWKGTTYDFSKYDDVTIFQRDGVQYAWLCLKGKKVTEVEVADNSEAIQFQAAFHAVMPRLHLGADPTARAF
jgi:hypothetical protein